MDHWYLRANWPKDFGWWDVIRDGCAFLAAIFALIAATIAFHAVQQQIAEARKEFFEQRTVARRTDASESLLAALLTAAALQLLRYDLDRMRNTFDDGVTQGPIYAERASFIRQKLNPLLLDSVLPYVGRLDHRSAEEYLLIAGISHRLREDDSPTTYEDMRELIVSVRDRVVALQTALNQQADEARATIQALS